MLVEQTGTGLVAYIDQTSVCQPIRPACGSATWSIAAPIDAVSAACGPGRCPDDFERLH